MDKTDAQVRALFQLDALIGHKPTSVFLTGCDLAWWCDLIHLRPGVVQQRLNFDESNLRLKKQGRSSTRVPAGWVGPPLFATKGSVVEGRAFVELASLVALPAGSALHAAKLGQIAEGKFPLRLPQLRDLMKAIEEAEIAHPKVDVIRNALDQFPEGVRTPEEVLAALTQQQEEREAKTETVVVSKEEPVQVVIVIRFQAELARRGLLPVLRKLHESSAEVRDICHSWSIDLGGEIFPGHFEVLVGSQEFELASQTFPELSSPLRELGEWLALERQLETEKKPEKKLPAPSKGLESPVASLPQPRALSETTVPKAVAPVVSVPVKVAVDRRPVISTLISQGDVPTRARTVEKDVHGVGWDLEGRQVILGAISIPLEPVSDVRLAGSTRTASKRVYDTLYAIRNAYKLDWPIFCSNLSMQTGWFSNLLTSKSQLSPPVLHNILVGLQEHYKLSLTPAELFGLAPLVLEVAEPVLMPDAGGKDELLFALGDARSGYRFASLLTKYRAVLLWFKRTYGVTDVHITRLEKGEIGVPLAVHHVMMWKVRERIERSEGVMIPRAYQWFLDQPHSQSIKNRSFVLDESRIPNQNWLSR